MISDVVIGFFLGLATWFGNLFPTFDTATIDGFMGAGSHVGDLNYYLPIAELAAVVLSVLALTPAFLIATLSIWLVAFVRGGSARA